MAIDAALKARLQERSQFIRIRTIDLINIAKNSHYSRTFSCADLFAALYYHTLRLDPTRPPLVLYAHYKLDAPGIAQVAEEFLLNGR